MRIIWSFLLLVISFQSFAKTVDENTARIVAGNFCKTEGVPATELSLVYTATSVVNGATVADFYVFNTGTTGFVIVSADDKAVPVLAYSTESSFNPGYIPAEIAVWLNNYKAQISYAISKNVSGVNTAKWNELLTANHVGAKTTALPGTPLCKTLWNQEPYYNALCPYDNTADTNALTGCVATAMAQVMKYWNWPRRGVGSHSYHSAYGTLSADFGATVFQWDSMPVAIHKVDTAVALLMYEAGVSVNMSYGVNASGAFVNISSSPVTNCAEYALETYFSYKSSTLQGVDRYSYSDSDWVHLIKSEVDAGRPTIYTGDGSQGGHCWVADGYTNGNRIHFNFGWGGYCNGYYMVEQIVPGGTDFNNNQTLMYGIEPDSSIIAGVKEMAGNGAAVSIYPNPAKQSVSIDLGNTKTTGISIIDMAGREVKRVAVANNAATVTIAVNGIPAGMYMVALQTVNGILTRKLVIEK